jgi:hypothetical protein
VDITQAMCLRGYLTEAENNYRLTTEGEVWLSHMGIDVAEVRHKRRVFASSCLDWSERLPHLAGALGASLATQFFKQRWITRSPTSRAVRLSEVGRRGLLQELDLQF